MRREYLALDHMRSHWVSVKRSRTTLLAWAKQSKIPNIRRRAILIERGKLKRFGIFVKSHPFISTGWKRARPKINPMLRKMVSQVVNI